MLNELKKYETMQSVIERCNDRVLEVLQSSNVREAKIAAESFKNGGKRLRPALMILSSLAPSSEPLDSVDEPLIDLAWSTGVLLLSLNILLFIFNMLPVPPLDGWHVLKGLIPGRSAYQLEELEARYQQYTPMIFFGVILLLFWTGFLGPIINGIARFLLGL